jgi:UDP-glucose 4-epimerase
VGDVYFALEQPNTAAAANVQGTANVMEAALRNRVAKVVYTSTWEVYGKPRYQPIDEDHPCEPDHPYNITKLAGERIALAYDRLKGVPTVALRLGTAYGPGMRPNAVFSIFFRRAIAGEPIVIKGDGRQYRQFTHASDIGRAFALAVESELRGEALNVVADEPTSIRDLAEMVVALFPTAIEYEPAREGDVEPAHVSSARAQERLRWRAKVAMREGIRQLAHEYAAP